MSTVQYIDPAASIGDSLSIINNNFLYLDVTLKQIHGLLDDNLNAGSYGEDLFKKYIEAASVVNKYKQKWDNAYTLISTNSSKWLMPVSLMYPCIIDNTDYKVDLETKETITSWLNKNFPVTANNSPANYPNDQKALVAVTFKEYIQHFEFTDETIFPTIQTLEFTVKDCIWQMTGYFAELDINYGITPTPTPAYTPSSTPVSTPTPTASVAAKDTLTYRLVPTPTPTFVDFFTMLVLEYKPADTLDGYVKLLLNCTHGGHFIIKVKDRVFYADSNVPVYINELEADAYDTTITNFNRTYQLTTSVKGTLNITNDINTTIFTYNGVSVPANTIIKSS